MRCHCEPRVTYRTPSRRCADDWWSRSPVRSHDVRVAPRRSAGARSMRTCDAVKLGWEPESETSESFLPPADSSVLAPLEDRWGEIAQYPDLIDDYADRMIG